MTIVKFDQPHRPHRSREHIADAFRQSLAPTPSRFDELDLFETVALASNDLIAAGRSIYGAYDAKESATDEMLASVRSACRSALAALDQYERVAAARDPEMLTD